MKFAIVSHVDRGQCALIMRDRPVTTGGPSMLDFERESAIAEGTELVVMYEFEVTGDDDPKSWEIAKAIKDAFWAGYDAPRLSMVG